MESPTKMERAFRSVAGALASVDGGDEYVAAWLATAAGLADEFQLMTEKEWRRLLRVGLRLTPEAAVQRKRIRGDKADVSSDEVRLPTKPRRLNGETRIEDQRSIYDAASVEDPHQPTKSCTGRRLHRITPVGKELADAAAKSSLFGKSCANLSDDTSTGSPPSHEEGIDADTIEKQEQLPLLQHRVSENSAAKYSKQHKLYAALQKVVVEGLCIDDDGETNNNRAEPSTSHQAQPSPRPLVLPSNPLWLITKTASTRFHEVIRGFCGIPSALLAFSFQDSLDYDMLWIEENDQKQWTMFGEPSIPGNFGMKNNQQHSTKRKYQYRQKDTGSKWKFW
ncbi:unnamed protein product [Phytophthora lilii]|uniref:Unnamed protein product n=1 Tax=Phytophthora lilii TaxID=2077276 RepID=A0A9W6TI76_9STRA|nr:unnamed protein product [Phytophthora lilii]